MLTVFIGIVCFLCILYLLSQYTFWRPVRSRNLPRVLMYHSVGRHHRSGMNVPPEIFAQHLAYLKKSGCKICTISQLVRDNPDHAAVITFDDGFLNNYTEAFPLLQKYNMPAVIYLAPEIQGIEKLHAQQIREMHHSGLIEFGAHTMTHPNLCTLSDDKAMQEIQQSQQAVERLTGQVCKSFAYPYGRFEHRHVDMLKQLGFTSAVTVKKDIQPLRDPYRIHRISINGKANMLQFHIAFLRGRYRV